MPWDVILSVLALIVAMLSIALRLYGPGDLDQLARELRSLAGEVVDLDDRVTTWMKRENVRRARDKKEEAEAAPAAGAGDGALDRAARIAQIRLRAKAARSVDA